MHRKLKKNQNPDSWRSFAKFVLGATICRGADAVQDRGPLFAEG
jgi:hypothetical protein